MSVWFEELVMMFENLFHQDKIADSHNALHSEATAHLSSPPAVGVAHESRHVGRNLLFAGLGAAQLIIGARCPEAAPGFAMLLGGTVTEALSLPDLIRGIDEHFDR